MIKDESLHQLLLRFYFWGACADFNISIFAAVHISMPSTSTPDVRRVLEAQTERVAVQVGRTQKGDARTSCNTFSLTRVIAIVFTAECVCACMRVYMCVRASV